MRRVGRGWTRFWFEPQPTSSLAVFRIVFALVVIAWTAALLPDLDAFFGPNGIEPQPPVDLAQGWWGVLNIVDTHTVVVVLFVVLLAGAVCLLVGYRTRLASVIVFVGLLSFEQRTPSIFNSGDGLLRSLAFFLMFAPAGAALSLDRRRTSPGRFWEFPARAPWALRLIQIQVSVMYLASVWEKLHGAAWRDGTAVSLVMRLPDFERFSPPGFLTHSLLVSSVMSWWTLAVELMVGILVWNRSARPLVLALGASLHIGIDLTLRIGFFSLTVLTAYIAFLSPATARALLLAVRDRIPVAAVRRRAHETAATAATAAPPGPG
jgi:hypothetical protein